MSCCGLVHAIEEHCVHFHDVVSVGSDGPLRIKPEVENSVTMKLAFPRHGMTDVARSVLQYTKLDRQRHPPSNTVGYPLTLSAH